MLLRTAEPKAVPVYAIVPMAVALVPVDVVVTTAEALVLPVSRVNTLVVSVVTTPTNVLWSGVTVIVKVSTVDVSVMVVVAVGPPDCCARARCAGRSSSKKDDRREDAARARRNVVTACILSILARLPEDRQRLQCFGLRNVESINIRHAWKGKAFGHFDVPRVFTSYLFTKRQCLVFADRSHDRDVHSPSRVLRCIVSPSINRGACLA